MKKTILISFNLLMAIGILAQPNFTSGDMPNIGNMDTILNYPFSGDINDIDAETGSGYSWDFSNEFFFSSIYNVETYRVKTDPISTPYVDATIEHYMSGTSGTNVSLYDYSNDTLFIHRIGAGGSGTPFVPPLASVNFPIAFNQTSDITWPLYASGNLTGERRTTVLYDGFGTLTLPNNRTFNNVFRIKKVEVDSSYITNSTITYLSYVWYKQGGGVPLYKITSVNGTSLTKFLNNSADATVTGLTEVNNDFSTEVYPNPTNGQVTIKTDNKLVSIQLLDINGKQVNKIDLNSKTLDLSELKSGVYFLQLTTDKTVKTVKILKD